MPDSMPTLAITGATGFLGRHLVSECILQDRFKLRLLTRHPYEIGHLSSNKVAICEGDLLKPESFRDFLQPDSTLMHLAFKGNAWNANIEAIYNLIKAVKQSGVKRVVHCSTALVIGFRANGVVTEETRPAPKGEYQETKYQIENILLAELPPSVELAILRPTEIIGPGGQGLQSLVKRLQNGGSYKTLFYHFILKSRLLNYVSVYNVVAALILLATSPIKQMSEIYNISDDDDADNNYAAVERIINSSLDQKHANSFDIGLPRSFLSLLFKLLPSLSPPNRVYSHSKIASMGYRKVVTLQAAIYEIVSGEAINARS
jgi:nucleoside-diphosphate-sugar epimerase